MVLLRVSLDKRHCSEFGFFTCFLWIKRTVLSLVLIRVFLWIKGTVLSLVLFRVFLWIKRTVLSLVLIRVFFVGKKHCSLVWYYYVFFAVKWDWPEFGIITSFLWVKSTVL